MSLLSQYWVARGILVVPIKIHAPKKALSSGTIRSYLVLAYLPFCSVYRLVSYTMR